MAKLPPTTRPPRTGPRAARGGKFTLEPIELVPPTPAPTFKERWLPIVLVAALAFIAYVPSLDNGFVSWDDDHYIYKNHQVHYDDGIRSIWFDVFRHDDKKFQGDGRTEDRVSHQYYPMVFTLYWLEFQAHKWFGNADPLLTIEENIEQGNMTGFVFHLNSVLLHMVNVMLLVFCFRKLGISNWVAWAATILFALHPMNASSVAWAAERKNIISLMFYLLSLMSYIKLRREGKWWRYVLALVLYQAALFSKTVALTLPVMLFFTDRLLERRWDLRLIGYSLLRIAPFVILSGIAAWTTINVEDRARTIPITAQQRPLLPAAVLLWYPYKLLLPIGQSPVYSLWPVEPSFLWALPTLAAIALGALVIVFRRRLGPVFIWALLFYCVTQGPMLGLKNINYFQFAYVADHYFYHGAVGLMLMLALAFDGLRRRIKPPRRGSQVATAIVCLLALGWGARTFSYVNVWTDAESFWAHILERHPDCWPGWYNTANARRRDASEIIERLNKPTLTDEERASLRQRAADLRAEAAREDLSDVQRRDKALEAHRVEVQADRPDLSAEDMRKLEADRDALFDEAVRRYKIVRDIHQLITQPFDRWIEVRARYQRDWRDAYEAAYEAGRRFPQLTHYLENAGQYAFNAKDYAKSAEAYRLAAGVYETRNRAGWLSKLVECYGKAAMSAQLGGLHAEAIASYVRAGELANEYAQRVAASDHCQAAEAYDKGSRLYAAAYDLDKSRKDLQRLAVDLAKKQFAERELCPNAQTGP